MDLQVINVGRLANDGTGDDLRTANQKNNANTAILKAAVQDAQGSADAAVAAVAAIVVSGFAKRTAAEAIPAKTYVVDQIGGMCVIADPTNMSHRGLVLGLVVDATAEGDVAVAQATGSIDGVDGTFGGGDRLYIGDGITGRIGSIVNRPPVARPDKSIWEQQVGTATTTTLIVGLLGSDILVPALGSTAVVSPLGAVVVATPFARTVLGLLGRKMVSDADYTTSGLYSWIGLTALTAGRTITLPAAASYPPGQSFVVADESGVCSLDMILTVNAATGDTIAGNPSVVLASPYACLTLRSNGDHLWLTV